MEAVIGTEQSVQRSLAVLQELFGNRGPTDFAIRLWDGTQWKPSCSQKPKWTLVLKHPGALRRMFLRLNDISLGEAYIHDDFDIEGEVEECFFLAECLLEMRWTYWEKLRLARYLLALPSPSAETSTRRPPKLNGRAHSKRRDMQAVRYHYDISNDFFRLWLDEEMVYSCAYFGDAGESLESAQVRKLDYICRKLRLKPGERLLDIGCGWGGLILHAAQHYGVVAYGITLSPAQAQLAQERISTAGLDDCCRVDVCDYRDLNRPNAFDKIVSVGMVEHVGENNLPLYFSQIRQLLRPGGTFLNHGIAANSHHPLPPSPTFVDRYVFPDGDLIPVTDMLRIAELSGFEIRDVENLREHYALTLRHWLRRLEKNRREAVELTDEATYRIWRLYMAGSAYFFRIGRLNVFQSLLVKPEHGESNLPLTREDLYEKSVCRSQD